MALRFPDYDQTLAWADAHPEERLVDIEEKRYHTDHAVVSFYLARSWGLPENVLKIILCHAREMFRETNLSLPDRMAMAVLMMTRAFQFYWRHFEEAPFWLEHQAQVMELLGLMPDEVLNLREDAEARLFER